MTPTEIHLGNLTLPDHDLIAIIARNITLALSHRFNDNASSQPIVDRHTMDLSELVYRRSRRSQSQANDFEWSIVRQRLLTGLSRSGYP